MSESTSYTTYNVKVPNEAKADLEEGFATRFGYTETVSDPDFKPPSARELERDPSLPRAAKLVKNPMGKKEFVEKCITEHFLKTTLRSTLADRASRAATEASDNKVNKLKW